MQAKDTLRPHIKKPMNSFFVYRKAVRDKIIELHGSLKSHEISRIAGEWWAKESDDNRKRYQQLSQEMYTQHRRDYPDYKFPSSHDSKSKASKKSKNINAQRSTKQLSVKLEENGLKSSPGHLDQQPLFSSFTKNNQNTHDNVDNQYHSLSRSSKMPSNHNRTPSIEEGVDGLGLLLSFQRAAVREPVVKPYSPVSPVTCDTGLDFTSSRINLQPLNQVSDQLKQPNRLPPLTTILTKYGITN
ncbi:high mobility group box domain-containing protein [Globomyces pollinis-pini]|nr:high mobility group box domain-containing protein [Globomyces pollinis-pini]KAJ2992608.1 Transcription factor Sox-8 [Globomyces sp. JEL0801]